MFGRKKDQAEAPAAPVHVDRPGAKNRPTPKRSVQEAARKKPLVVTDRKAARATARASRREAAATQRAAMLTGDERFLPARDRGPVRRYIRDVVDSRWTAGEFLLPVMIVTMVLMLIQQTWAASASFLLLWGYLFVAIFDGWLMWRRLKRRLYAKFGDEGIVRGNASYAILRAYQLRRSRMPKPQVKRGDTVS